MPAGVFPGTCNSNTDPMCVDPAGGNLRLLYGSPCIDEGDSDAVPAGVTTDYDGGPRFTDDADSSTECGVPPEGVVVDRGAFEYAPCLGDFDLNGSVEFSDILRILSMWGPCGGCPEDIDGNGSVDFNDILQLLSNWGICTS